MDHKATAYLKNIYDFDYNPVPPDNLTCKKCRTVKLITDFYNSKNSAWGKSTVCKKCSDVASEKYRKKNPIAARNASYRWWIKNRNKLNAENAKRNQLEIDSQGGHMIY